MTLSPTALAQYDASQLAAALTRAQQRIQELEQENSALRTEIRWIDRLLAVPASIMPPSHKVTLRAAVKAYQQATPDEHGLVQIESWKLCKTVGQSRQTFLENLTYCAEKLGILTKKRERVVESDTNDYSTNLYIGVTPQLAHPQDYKVETPRNHGGERQLCPHCQSDQLQRKVTITCMNCGSVLDEKISLVNQGCHLDDLPKSHEDQSENGQFEEDQEPLPDTNVNLTSIKTNVLTSQLDDSLLSQQEPPTPPDGVALSAPTDEQPQAHTMGQADALTQAAQLLVEIAGPEPVHIEMSPRGPKKYYDVKRALTPQDARTHLKGWKTKGAYLRRPDGMTRALCYDADTPEDWESLLDAARLLSEVGYLPVVEDSPAGRGGHLWILYTRQVSASAAHQHVVHVAPMLQQIKEAWPGPGQNKVRLPGGKYVKPGFSVWCKLHDAHGARIAEDGQSAAWVLLDYQTPAELVADEVNPQEVPPSPGSLVSHAAPAASEPEPCGTAAAQTGELAALPNDGVGQQHRKALRTPPEVDQQWQQKYSQHLWFHFTPAMLSAWYNERHQVQNILPSQENGMGFHLAR